MCDPKKSSMTHQSKVYFLQPTVHARHPSRGVSYSLVQQTSSLINVSSRPSHTSHLDTIPFTETSMALARTEARNADLQPVIIPFELDPRIPPVLKSKFRGAIENVKHKAHRELVRANCVVRLLADRRTREKALSSSVFSRSRPLKGRAIRNKKWPHQA
jgi:hypothetical protein